MQVFKRWGLVILALFFAVGWSYREVAFALDRAREVASGTIQPRSNRDEELLGQRGAGR